MIVFSDEVTEACKGDGDTDEVRERAGSPGAMSPIPIHSLRDKAPFISWQDAGKYNLEIKLTKLFYPDQ